MSSRKSKRFLPAIEGLEDRTTPAGDVAVAVIGGSLIVIGDDAGNALRISQTRGGVVDVSSADNATTINGGGQFQSFVGFKGHVNIVMGGGDDSLILRGLRVGGALHVDMGDGNDMLTVHTTFVQKDASLSTGNGNDALQLGGSTVKMNSYINVGVGNNTVNLLDATFGKNSYFEAGVGNSILGSNDSFFKNGPSVKGFTQTFRAALATALPQTATVAKGGTANINVVANAIAGQGTIDNQSVVVISGPAHGTATLNGDGTIKYVNNGTNFSTDSFTYSLQNTAGGGSNIATVSITITGVTGPTVVLSTTTTSPTNTTAIPMTVVFSEAVTGFTLSDIALVNGIASALTSTDNKTFTFSVKPVGQGNITASIIAGAVTGESGIINTASNTLSLVFDSISPTITLNPLVTNSSTPTLTGTVSDSTATVTVAVNNVTVNATVTNGTWSAPITTAMAAGTYSVTATVKDSAGNTASTTNATGLIIDQTPPTTTISSAAPDPTNAAFTITVTFSESVTGFVSGDITVTNGTVSNFSGSGTTYTATVTPTTNGLVTVAVAANVATDAAGNQNTAATNLTRTFDNTQPTTTISSNAPDPTNTTIPILITFSESVTGFTAADIVVTNGTVSGFSGSGTTYTATVTATAPGLVTVAVPAGVAQDSAGNQNTAAVNLTRTFDNTQPTTTISSNAPDPTNTTIPITVTFSEAVTGFTSADINVTNGTVSGFSGSGTTYTATVTATAPGLVTVAVPAGVAEDSAGNQNTAAVNLTRTFDNVAPTVGVSSTTTSPTSDTSIPVTFLFSEAVTGFTDTDVVVTNGTLSAFSGSGTTYTATFTRTAVGASTIDVPAGVATDAAGNLNTASPQFMMTFI